MSMMFCSKCGKEVLRSKIAEHNAIEHPRPSTSQISGENPLTAALLMQIQENQRLKGQQYQKRKRPVTVQKVDTEEKQAKKQKVKHYDYHDFCSRHINPGDCIVKECDILRDYIRTNANQSIWNMCQKVNILLGILHQKHIFV